VQKTYYPKAEDLTPEWILLDAKDQTLGRLATNIASILLGKNKPTFTPGIETGDFVIVINAEKVAVTGKKVSDKYYYRHSEYPGGLTEITLNEQLVKHPDRVIKLAVKGMLPHNRYGRSLLKRLKVYAGPEHPHAAQRPKTQEQVT
jgi:large subunit ribosomal protein L13